MGMKSRCLTTLWFEAVAQPNKALLLRKTAAALGACAPGSIFWQLCLPLQGYAATAQGWSKSVHLRHEAFAKQPHSQHVVAAPQFEAQALEEDWEPV